MIFLWFPSLPWPQCVPGATSAAWRCARRVFCCDASQRCSAAESDARCCSAWLFQDRSSWWAFHGDGIPIGKMGDSLETRDTGKCDTSFDDIWLGQQLDYICLWDAKLWIDTGLLMLILMSLVTIATLQPSWMSMLGFKNTVLMVKQRCPQHPKYKGIMLANEEVKSQIAPLVAIIYPAWVGATLTWGLVFLDPTRV